MAHHVAAHVPEFGNWDAQDQVPYTAIFDTAHAGKGGANKFNPNDPAENTAAFGSKSEDVSSAEIPSKPQPAVGTGPPIQNRHNGEGHEYSKTGSVDALRRGPSTSGAREKVGPEESPNHQVYQGRLGNKPGSPYWERKNPPEGGNAYAPSTPGRSRLRGSTRADETPNRSAALPEFGKWDENDPSAGEGFTMIFTQHRIEKKQGGPVLVPSLHAEPSSHVDGYKQGQAAHYQKKSSFWSCCLGSSASD